MFANQKSQLPKYLNGLMRDKSGSSTTCNAMGSTFMKNFRDLLVFWQDHYLHKDKDCSALERVRPSPFYSSFQCEFNIYMFYLIDL